MSANNQLIIWKIKGLYCVFENHCVDNEIKKPKSDKNSLYSSAYLQNAINWANQYCSDNLVEYGVDVRI